MTTRRGSLTLYFIFVFTITWGIAALLLLLPNQMAALFGPMSARNPIFFLAVYAPTLSALLLTATIEGWAGVVALLSRMVRWRFGLQWYLFVLLGIPVLGLCATAWGGGTPLYPWGQWYLYIPLLLSQIFVDPGALGEELGWRGYALPRLLARYQALWASLILGAIWFVWHLPAFFVSGAPQNSLSLPAFFMSALALSILATWLYNNTGGSVLPSMLLHLTANFSLNMLGAPLVQFGALLVITAFIVVVATRGGLSEQKNTEENRLAHSHGDAKVTESSHI
jgi:membrane protease YdiL (CAAX protease family)